MEVYSSVAPEAGLDLRWLGQEVLLQVLNLAPQEGLKPSHCLFRLEMCCEDREALLATGVDDHLIN